MIVNKIHYFGTYPVGATWQKIGMEAQIIEGDDIRQGLYALKRQVEEFHYESTKAAEKEMIREQQHVNPNAPYEIGEGKTEPITLTKVAELIKEINFCRDFDALEKAYKYIAATDPDLQHAYDLRREQLKQIEIKRLLEKTNAKTKP